MSGEGQKGKEGGREGGLQPRPRHPDTHLSRAFYFANNSTAALIMLARLRTTSRAAQPAYSLMQSRLALKAAVFRAFVNSGPARYPFKQRQVKTGCRTVNGGKLSNS